jgi:hypothetical protein
MGNVLSRERREQVIALERLAWSLRRTSSRAAVRMHRSSRCASTLTTKRNRCVFVAPVCLRSNLGRSDHRKSSKRSRTRQRLPHSSCCARQDSFTSEMQDIVAFVVSKLQKFNGDRSNPDRTCINQLSNTSERRPNLSDWCSNSFAQ